MLVLSRKLNEVVMIGDDTWVKVLEFGRKGGEPFVRLGFVAPQAVPVHRQEVYDAIQCEKRGA